MKTILFICSANVVRSAMAEAWFNHLAANNPQLHATSAAIAGFSGDSPAEKAVHLMKKAGVDISNHRSRNLTPYLVDEADLIFGVTQSHAQYLTDHFPEATDKIFLLSKATDIPNPDGKSDSFYQNCFNTIKPAVANIYSRLSGE